ncbi:MAG TPA: hypothetical protein DCZ72_11735, partial [Armatimonadetes bacterium]|nr:hypothetical protein [Armatimonadota bacterium]
RRPLLALWATGEAPVTIELDLGAHEVIPRGLGGTPLSLTGAPLRLTLGPAPVLLEARVRAYDQLVAAAETVRVVGAE